MNSLEMMYRQLWQETFSNKYFKPLLWIDKDNLLRKQRQDIEEEMCLPDSELDRIFEEEKQKFLKSIN